jgi:ribosomal protein S3
MKTIPEKIPTRVVLYTRDIENITGRRGRTARQLLQKIRNALGKSKDEFITIKEFSLFTGIDEDLIKDFLQS